MAHHAYFVTGDLEEGIANAHTYIAEELDMVVNANPNIMTLRHGLLSVDDARRLRSLAELSSTNIENGRTVLVISASRLFHEAQNALLKLFEEPPEQTTLILVIPAEGMLLPTLRSRLLELPKKIAINKEKMKAERSSEEDLEKTIAKILDRAKSDKDDEKQAARLSAIQLLEELTRNTHARWLAARSKGGNPSTAKNLELQLTDLNTFLPILHERSAPLKQIFEHLLITYS